MTEYVDLVDERGEVQVPYLTREEAFANRGPNLFVPIAVGVIFDGLGRVVTQQRSRHKPVDKNKLDLVCGVVSSGEQPEVTIVRETEEEVEVTPTDIVLIAEGVNIYKRYRYLLVGQTIESANITVPNHEVEWAAMKTPDEIRAFIRTGQYTPVGDLIEHLALAERYVSSPQIAAA